MKNINLILGTSHADDLIYIAKFLPLNAEEIELDAAMVNVMTNIFGNFIKTGYILLYKFSF